MYIIFFPIFSCSHLNESELSVTILKLSASKFEADDQEFEVQIKRQKYGPTTELTTKTDFPVQAWQPKVQTPYYVPPGETPRRVEIER